MSREYTISSDQPASLRRQALIGVVVTAVFCLTLQGCGHGCNDYGCAPMAELLLSQPLALDRPCRIEVSADDNELSCSIAGDGSQPTCSDGLYLSSRNPNPVRGYDVIGISGQPETVVFSIESEGRTLAADEFNPTYVDVEVDGPGCGGCPMAAEEIEVE